MSVRTWLYSQLIVNPVAAYIGGTENPRAYTKKSMTSNVEDTPYIVYKLGYSANEDIAEDMSDGTTINRQFAQVWVHDYSDGETADYMRIDEVVAALRKALHGKSSKEDGVIFCRYIETSQDLNDETLNTVMRYVRFQIETKEA